MDWNQEEKSQRKRLQDISGTPLDLNLVLERTTMHNSNWNIMNTETNITVKSLYMWMMCCVFTYKLGSQIFMSQGPPECPMM